jgi:hypothetical protein
MHRKQSLDIPLKTLVQRLTFRMPGHWTLVLLGLCGVLLYAVVMSSMMVSQIEVTKSHHKVLMTLTSGHGRLSGSNQLPGSTRGHSRKELALKEPQQQRRKQPEQKITWEKFWGTNHERGECQKRAISRRQDTAGLQQKGIAGVTSSLACGHSWYSSASMSS